jgi:hypothetical protein
MTLEQKLEIWSLFIEKDALLNKDDLKVILEALKVSKGVSNEVEQKREDVFHKLQRNDFVKYTGGSISIHLTIGNRYRLTRSPYRDRICLIADNGKRMNTKSKYFETV